MPPLSPFLLSCPTPLNQQVTRPLVINNFCLRASTTHARGPSSFLTTSHPAPSHPAVERPTNESISPHESRCLIMRNRGDQQKLLDTHHLIVVNCAARPWRFFAQRQRRPQTRVDCRAVARSLSSPHEYEMIHAQAKSRPDAAEGADRTEDDRRPFGCRSNHSDRRCFCLTRATIECAKPGCQLMSIAEDFRYSVKMSMCTVGDRIPCRDQ